MPARPSGDSVVTSVTSHLILEIWPTLRKATGTMNQSMVHHNGWHNWVHHAFYVSCWVVRAGCPKRVSFVCYCGRESYILMPAEPSHTSPGLSINSPYSRSHPGHDCMLLLFLRCLRILIRACCERTTPPIYVSNISIF